MLNKRNGFALSAAALALVLAGCGGGSGGTDTSSPVSSRNTNPSASAADTATPANALAASLKISARHEKAPDDTRQPVSASGVRGDVLRTMLEQKPCANPAQTADLYGPRVDPKENPLPAVEATSSLSPDNYVDNPNPSYPPPATPFFNISCSDEFRLFQPAQPGQFTLEASSGAHYTRPSVPLENRGVNTVESKVPIYVTANDVSLGAEIQTKNIVDRGFGGHNHQIPLPEGPLNEELTLRAEASFSFDKNSHVPYGVLMNWADGDNVQRLMLFPGQQGNQARLCWHTNLRHVKRLHCMSWNVPDMWSYGERLKLDDQYMIDDRSVYPNEQGLVFWHYKRF
ncbi:MAG: hypothetical protein Q4D91_02575 [Lautropia sp.]|nr:hypothetical protein [Lautropia sp.]